MEQHSGSEAERLYAEAEGSFGHWEVTKDLVDEMIDLMLNYRQSGHPGGSRSKVHAMLATLLSGAMRWDILRPWRPFCDRFVQSVDRLRQAVNDFTLDHVSARTGVPEDQIVEAARVLGQRSLNAFGDDISAGVEHLFRILTSRHPTTAEQAIVRQLFEEQVTYFTEHPDASSEFLKNGDAEADTSLDASRLAAISVVANTLMNFDECVMKK